MIILYHLLSLIQNIISNYINIIRIINKNIMSAWKYCADIICFYSDNDPYVAFEVEKEFADTIASEQHVIKNGGHINAESGYTSFEEILKYL